MFFEVLILTSHKERFSFWTKLPIWTISVQFGSFSFVKISFLSWKIKFFINHNCTVYYNWNSLKSDTKHKKLFNSNHWCPVIKAKWCRAYRHILLQCCLVYGTATYSAKRFEFRRKVSISLKCSNFAEMFEFC